MKQNYRKIPMIDTVSNIWIRCVQNKLIMFVFQNREKKLLKVFNLKEVLF